MYNSQDGQQIWERKTSGAVLFGWQEENMLYAGTSDSKIYSFSKIGEQGQIYTCDAGVFSVCPSLLLSLGVQPIYVSPIERT